MDKMKIQKNDNNIDALYFNVDSFLQAWINCLRIKNKFILNSYSHKAAPFLQPATA